MTTEPADGSHVAVRPFREDEFSTRVYRREDAMADANGLGEARWFSRTDHNEPACTWEHLTDIGDIAYVGAFVNRR